MRARARSGSAEIIMAVGVSRWCSTGALRGERSTASCGGGDRADGVHPRLHSHHVGHTQVPSPTPSSQTGSTAFHEGAGADDGAIGRSPCRVSIPAGSELDRFEYPLLILLAAIGIMLMISANDYALYLGLELQSLAATSLTPSIATNARSMEAGLKYFVLGALASGSCSTVLAGYGFTGTVPSRDRRVARVPIRV